MSIRWSVVLASAVLVSGPQPVVGQEAKDVGMSYAAKVDDEKEGDVEFCVVHVEASDEWREQHEWIAQVDDVEMEMPAVFRSPAESFRENRLSASNSGVEINGVPVQVSVEPEAKLEVVLVSFEVFDNAIEGKKRALVTRFTLRPISEIEDYVPPKPNQMRIGMSSFLKFEKAEPFPGLEDFLANAVKMPGKVENVESEAEAGR